MSVEELISLQECMQESGLEILKIGYLDINDEVTKAVIVFEVGETGFDLCLFMDDHKYFEMVSQDGYDLEKLYWPVNGVLCNEVNFDVNINRCVRPVDKMTTKFYPLNSDSFEIIRRMVG